jgi:hypothetical protein
MDYVTRQFINLTKRLLRESRKAFTSLGIDLHHIKNAIQSIDKNARANQQKEQPKIEVVALVHQPEGAETKRKAEYDRAQRRDRIRLAVEWLTFFAVVFYGYMAVRQWREQISARHQTQGAIEAANRSATASESANADAEEHFSRDERPYVGLNSFPTPSGETAGPKNTGNYVAGEHDPADANKSFFTWSLHYKNFGKSPAIHIRTDIRVEIGPNAFQKWRWTPTEQKGGAVLLPNGDVYTTGRSETICFGNAKTYFTTDGQIVAFGHIDYEGLDGRAYWTEFCVEYLATDAVVNCPTHNLMN